MSILIQIQLSVSKDGFVHFGDTVMLLNPVNESRVGNGPGTCGSLALAASLGETWPCAAGPPPAPREVSAVESTDPVGRNAFCVLRFDTSFCVVFHYCSSFQYIVLRNTQCLLTYK